MLRRPVQTSRLSAKADLPGWSMGLLLQCPCMSEQVLRGLAGRDDVLDTRDDRDGSRKGTDTLMTGWQRIKPDVIIVAIILVLAAAIAGLMLARSPYSVAFGGLLVAALFFPYFKCKWDGIEVPGPGGPL